MRKNILVISDNATHNSGVATQSKYLIDGLISTGNYKVYQLGASMYQDKKGEVQVINENFIIKNTYGFADYQEVRAFCFDKKIDAIIIFNDPRFFDDIFENYTKIKNICPVLYWHVWDNKPSPDFNRYVYESVDVINCHSYLTYEMCKELGYEKKSNFIPHAIPEDIFYQLSEQNIVKHKKEILGKDSEKFIFTWVNKNIKRKRVSDLLFCWKNFIEKVGEKSVLILHTNPYQKEGFDIISIINHLKIENSVRISNQNLSIEEMNILHNISDATINISHAEGFGLNVLEGMMCGTPPVALLTGGLIRQVLDYRDNTENGIAIHPDVRTINGNFSCPYIYEDFASHENISKSLNKMFMMTPEEYKNISIKCKNYANECFSYKETIKLWDESIQNTIAKTNNKKYKVETI